MISNSAVCDEVEGVEREWHFLAPANACVRAQCSGRCDWFALPLRVSRASVSFSVLSPIVNQQYGGCFESVARILCLMLREVHGFGGMRVKDAKSATAFSFDGSGCGLAMPSYAYDANQAKGLD